ncbi:hypothetical protein SUNI508_04552 [Seiridium unicorne]|uniref:Thioester reductase (TE) domain-containing protein n=1 Tax=Seiridium unicorne TaxID=138068 RepID=A0ABR2V7K0_9PEZI
MLILDNDDYGVAQRLPYTSHRICGTARSPSKVSKGCGAYQPPTFQYKVQKTREIFNSPHYDAVVVPEMEPEGAFDKAVKGVDAIIHLSSPLTSSPNPKEVVPTAVKGATSILRLALKESKIQRFVFTSSSTATSLPIPGVRFKIDNTTWNTEVDDYVDFPPLHKPENAFKVYSASKAKAEQALWNFVKEEKPNYAVNCINPAVNMGPVIDSPGETGGLVIKSSKGDVHWSFLLQYMVNVVDCARLHLIASIDGSVNNERILAFDVPFN